MSKGSIWMKKPGKVIKKIRFYKVICSNCGCEFEFDDWYAFEHKGEKANPFADGGSFKVYNLKCPYCNEEFYRVVNDVPVEERECELIYKINQFDGHKYWELKQDRSK